MHAAKLSKSDRLKRVRTVLMDGMKHTTRDLIRKSHCCAINSIVSELRQNGMVIDCQRVGDRWFYQAKV